jgi:hypothetical protein
VTASIGKRKAAAGVHTVVCCPSGERWVGHALDLDTIQNRLWFTLRHGSSAHRLLQTAWTRTGRAPSHSISSSGSDETLGYVRERALKDHLAHWRSALVAEAI